MDKAKLSKPIKDTSKIPSCNRSLKSKLLFTQSLHHWRCNYRKEAWSLNFDLRPGSSEQVQNPWLNCTYRITETNWPQYDLRSNGAVVWRRTGLKEVKRHSGRYWWCLFWRFLKVIKHRIPKPVFGGGAFSLSPEVAVVVRLSKFFWYD